MRAIITEGSGGPDVLSYASVPDPEPGPGEVLLRVAAAGVNRADLMQREGHYPPPPGASDIIGLEASGEVAAVGPDVDGWAEGDRAVALLAGGGYAELVVVPAGQLVPPPEGWDLVAAGGVIEVAATVWSNLDAAGLQAGETFLVHGGAGGIGSFAIGYAKALGATVITTAGSPEKLDYCRELGADLALSYREDWAAQIPDGVDVILDNTGAAYLATHTELLRPDGRLMIIGFQGGAKGEIDLGALLRKRALVHPMSLRGRPVEQKAAICAGVVRDIWPLLASGRLHPTRDTRLPLAEAARAHELLESGDNVGKIILTV